MLTTAQFTDNVQKSRLGTLQELINKTVKNVNDEDDAFDLASKMDLESLIGALQKQFIRWI